MKKKKWLAMLLAAMMAFSMAGCGGDDVDADVSEDSYAAEEVAEEEVAEEEIVEETAEDEEMENADFVGNWACVGYEQDGQALTEDDCGKSYLTLYDNYETDVTIMNIDYKGEWDFTESGVVLYLYDGSYEEEIYCDLYEGLLYMDYMNMYTLFTKD